MEKVITNYEGQKDDEISTTAKSVITGLTPNVAYSFAAAYKGNDNEPLVWTDGNHYKIGVRIGGEI